VRPDGGHAHSYALARGWERSYPETTGYLIPTLLRLGEAAADRRFTDSALRAGAWLLQIQRHDGSFPDLAGSPQVFDTGQIVEGLLALHRSTGDAAYLASARRAGDFLLSAQDPEGTWTRLSYNSAAHTYYTRVAANLLRLAAACGEERYRDGAMRNLRWALAQQLPNGYFRHMAFAPKDLPYLHTIVYVLEGLLDGHRLSGEPEFLGAVERTVSALLAVSGEGPVLFSQYNERWEPFRREMCTTGLAQWAGLLLDLRGGHGREHLQAEARRTLDWLKSRQVRSTSPDIAGALSGSVPLWGRYFRFAFNNWTVKFFIDALLKMERETQGRPA
jgi:uncharacterized protein YyaL (SSP411 family)